jgi:hypothetical protein
MGCCGHKYPVSRPTGQTAPQVMGRYRVRPIVVRPPAPPQPLPAPEAPPMAVVGPGAKEVATEPTTSEPETKTDE